MQTLAHHIQTYNVRPYSLLPNYILLGYAMDWRLMYSLGYIDSIATMQMILSIFTLQSIRTALLYKSNQQRDFIKFLTTFEQTPNLQN